MRLVVVLGFSAVLVGVGIALRSSPAYSVPSMLALIVGLCVAACVGALVVARQFKIGSAARPDEGVNARLRLLGDELVAVAEAVERRGMLALAESKVSVHSAVYQRIAERAVAGADPAALRIEARDTCEAQVLVSTHAARKHALMAQSMGVLSLLIATGFVAHALMFGQLLGFSDAAALGLLLLVYATFMLTVIAQDLAARTSFVAAEATLAGAMIGESVAHLRAGAGPGVIRAEVERLLAPPAPSATTVSPKARQAA